MLIHFLIENYLSFQNETILSMIPAKSRTMKEHYIVSSSGKKVTGLPLAAFFGANASGKSNFITAVKIFKNMVQGLDTSQGIPVTPFKLDAKCRKKPSRFEIMFKHEEVVYTYGFLASTELIQEEWLFAYYSNREVTLFERVSKPDDGTMVQVGKRLADHAKGGADALKLLGTIVSPRKLFLTECFERAIAPEVFKPVENWFRNCLHVIQPGMMVSPLPIMAAQDERFMSFFNDFIVSCDTGISAIESNREPFEPERHLNGLPEDLKAQILKELSQFAGKKGQVTVFSKNRLFNVCVDDKGETTYVKLTMQHQDSQGHNVPFEIYEESAGTQKLMHLVPLLQSMMQAEQVFFLDEMDNNMHSLLAQAFLKFFLKAIASGKARSQMVFTTHDTTLLDSGLFRRDEVIFVEKNAQGASQLISLDQFRINTGLRIGNGYLYGRFGAVPKLNKLEQVMK